MRHLHIVRRRSVSRNGRAIAGIALAIVAWTAPVHAHGRLDQMNDLPAATSFQCGDSGLSLFQSFTATESRLVAIDLRLRAGGAFPWGGTSTVVRIRSRVPAGEVLASSTAFVRGPLAAGAQVLVHFELHGLALTHGRSYVIEWLSPTPEGGAGFALGWMGREDDPYRGGSAFGCTGTDTKGVDYAFNTYAAGGLRNPFPHHGEAAALVGDLRRAAPEMLSFELIRLDVDGILADAGAGRPVRLPFAPAEGSVRAVPVELTATNIRSDGYRTLKGGPQGARDVPPPTPHTYRGRILGRTEGRALLSLKSGRGVEGYLMGPGGWSYVEPLAPMLFRLGRTKAEIEAALRVADHVAYSVADVVPLSYEHDDDPVSKILNGIPPPGELQSTITIALWGVIGFPEQFPSDAEAYDQMELVITMLDDILSDLVPNQTDGGFAINFTLWTSMLSPNSDPCPVGDNAQEVLDSTVTCPHIFLGIPEPDLIHIFTGPGIGGGHAFIRGLIKAGHQNHAVVGWATGDAGRLQLSMHELGHNIGAVHGWAASDWGSVDDVFLVGDFSHGDADDPSAGREDIIGGQLMAAGGYRWWAGTVRPSTHYDPDPSVSERVVNGPLDMMPAYLRHTSGSVPTVGSPADVILPGDFTGDGRYDLAVGIPVGGPMVFQVAAHESASRHFDTPLFWGAATAATTDTFLVADFNGDGNDDIAIGQATGGATVAWSVLVSSGIGFGLSSFAADAGEPGDMFRAGDVDGDGKADLVILQATSPSVVIPSVALSTGTAFSPAAPFGFDVGGTEYTFLMGDFNADGKDDLSAGHAVAGSAMEWLVAASNGTTFLPLAVWGTVPVSAASRFLPADVNGDGAKDLIHAFQPTGPGSLFRWFTHVSNGVGFGAAAALTRDVCITWGSFLGTPILSCGTDIMLLGYGYGYDGRHVTAFSHNNALNIRATLQVFNAGP